MADSSVAPADPRVLADVPAPTTEQPGQGPVVISEHAVMLGTAAAVSVPHETHTHHVIAAIRAFFHHSEHSRHAAHHHSYYPPRLDVVLEHAAMAREMHRL